MSHQVIMILSDMTSLGFLSDTNYDTILPMILSDFAAWISFVKIKNHPLSKSTLTNDRWVAMVASPNKYRDYSISKIHQITIMHHVCLLKYH